MRPGPAPIMTAAALVVAALAATAASCRTPRPCPAVPSSTAPSAPRRDHCLQPPWVIDAMRPQAGTDGWSAAICGGAGAAAYFIHDGPRPISEPELVAVQRAVVARFGAALSSGIGGCCSPEVAAKTKVVCLKVWLDLCRVPVDRVVAAVDEELGRRGLTETRVGVDVSVDGAVGPRCEPRNPACGPVPSRVEAPSPSSPAEAACATGRARLADPGERTLGGACVHDGECVVGACGVSCARWDAKIGNSVSCEDIGRVDDDDDDKPVVYCGCVAGHCGWFRPVAP